LGILGRGGEDREDGIWREIRVNGDAHDRKTHQAQSQRLVSGPIWVGGLDGLDPSVPPAASRAPEPGWRYPPLSPSSTLCTLEHEPWWPGPRSFALIPWDPWDPWVLGARGFRTDLRGGTWHLGDLEEGGRGGRGGSWADDPRIPQFWSTIFQPKPTDSETVRQER
jgi:hypothetical protein